MLASAIFKTSYWQQLATKSSCLLAKQSFSTTSPHTNLYLDPIKNFNDFKWPNQVSTFEHYRIPQELLDHEFNYPVCMDTLGIRWPGYWFKKKFVYVKEMEPELIVPDLTDFELKPYVSYRTEEVDTPPFTARDLFDRVYASRIVEDFRKGNAQDKYEVPSEEIDNARLRALQTGADMFEHHTHKGVRAPLEFTDY